MLFKKPIVIPGSGTRGILNFNTPDGAKISGTTNIVAAVGICVAKPRQSPLLPGLKTRPKVDHALAGYSDKHETLLKLSVQKVCQPRVSETLISRKKCYSCTHGPMVD